MRLLKFLILFLILQTAILSLIPSAMNAQHMRNMTLGIGTDAGFTIIHPIERYSVFVSNEASDSEIFDKNYEPFFKNFGMQYSFIIYYALSDKLELSFQPGLLNYNYKYYNTYDFTGSQSYSLRYDIKHNIRFVDLPLGLKYNFKGDKFTPYIHAGIYYGLRENSTKYITKTETGTFGEFEFEKESLGADSTVIVSNIGSFAGFGLSYNFKYSKIALEANFRYGFHNITDKNFRNNNNTLTGKYYDVPDDMRIMNISIGIRYTVSLKCVKKYPLPQYRDY